MKVGLFSPAIPPSPKGNSRSAGRLAEALSSIGVNVRLVELTAVNPEELKRCEKEVDLIHGFHLFSSFSSLSSITKPYILTQTGTDISSDFLQFDRYQSFVLGAKRIIVPHFAAEQKIIEYFPQISARISVIPKSVSLPLPGESLDEKLLQSLKEKLIILLPAHIRPIKGIKEAIAGFISFLSLAPAEDAAKCLLVLAGQVIDRDYYASLNIVRHPQVIHVELRPEQMRSMFERAHLVLNTSHVEGLANSLLEALYLGRPVLARHVPGNAGLRELAAEDSAKNKLQNDDSAVQFFSQESGPNSLPQRLAEILFQAGLLEHLTQSARLNYAWLGDTKREAMAYRQVYQEALAQ